MEIKQVIVPARITSSWEREVIIKKLAKIINRKVFFFNPSDISLKHKAVYDNKSPFGIACPGNKV